ncbi:LPS-assembly lipoprotein LptE [Paraglaciecola mesophila]|uniref:LPS-assembly lipoprotein LptE n=1 Tax=Paraglaciecola mesophila TaxID=197222 RepID=A0A857JGP7_9ALTE|nr:LPS assembly lipoprotein LptE [Paraglaciecola mesophila]QHJ10846.1 LPS-assembly lipoprotein LptE [Paraglaciecola mesophila]
MRNLIICLLCSVIISGCGFSLRGNYELPASVSQLRVGSAEAHSALERALRNELKPYNVDIIDASVEGHSDVTNIYLLSDELDRRLLSLFSTGQVAEYELIYTVRYELQFANSDAQLLEFDIKREYQDDPDAVLAKSRELELVLSEMRKQAAIRIIHQISVAQHTLSNSALVTP